MDDAERHRVIPSAVNSEAPVFRECTATEVAYLIGFWLVFWFTTLGLIGYFMGFFVGALSLSFILMLASAFFSAMVMEDFKSGKTDHYYQHRARRWLQALGVSDAKIIDRTGRWDTQRSQTIVVIGESADS